MATWREQYDRMKRRYDRFVEIDQGRKHEMASDNYLDDIYAFFLDYYHLKDWLKNDSAVPGSIRQAVEGCVNANRSLQLCADICNSLKHLKRTSNRSGENPTFGKKQFAVGLGSGIPTTISLKYEVNTSSGPEDAFKLATDCLSEWDTFLSASGL